MDKMIVQAAFICCREKVFMYFCRRIRNNRIKEVINLKLIKFKRRFLRKYLLKNYQKYLLTKKKMYILHKVNFKDYNILQIYGSIVQSIKKLSTGKKPYFLTNGSYTPIYPHYPQG